MTRINCCLKCGSTNLDTSGTRCLEYGCDWTYVIYESSINLVTTPDGAITVPLINPFTGGY